jgi:hypothetical protein
MLGLGKAHGYGSRSVVHVIAKLCLFHVRLMLSDQISNFMHSS